jgi:hypothetical protein
MAVAHQIHELMARRSGLRERRQPAHLSQILETGRGLRLSPINRERKGRQIALIEPGVILLSEHALKALAVELEPAIMRAVDVRRQIAEAVWSDLAHLFLNLRLTVLELERGQRGLQIGGVCLPHIPRLCRTGQYRGDWILLVGKLSCADEAVACPQLLFEMMEDEHPLTQAIGADLKAGTVMRKRVLPGGPGARR